MFFLGVVVFKGGKGWCVVMGLKFKFLERSFCMGLKGFLVYDLLVGCCNILKIGVFFFFFVIGEEWWVKFFFSKVW